MKKAKITFYPNELKKSKKTGLIPIYLRISKGNSKNETRLDATITDKELKFWNKMTQRLDIANNDVNYRLEKITEDFKGLKFIFKENYQHFNIYEIKEKLLNPNNNENSENILAIEYINNHFKNHIFKNNNIEEGTKKNYQKAINHFLKFLIFMRKQQIALSSINKSLAFEFYDYLQQEIPSINKRAMKDVSASSLIIKISAIFNRAFETGLIKINPFKGIKLQTNSKKKDELNSSEVKALVQLNLNNEKKLQVYRDIFLFQIFTGLPYGEIENLTRDKLNEENNEIVLETNRRKTNIHIKQILVKQAVEIVNRYKNNFETYTTNLVFPKRHLNNMNDYLKIIQQMAGITKNISTHIARHTCCQFLCELGNINSDVINTMLGWSNKKLGSSMVYRRVSFIMLQDAKNKFEEFINKNICLI